MASATSKVADESVAPVIQSQDLVASLPAPVFRLLVLFARPISLLRVYLEVLLWKNGRRVESWMLLVAWWTICLGSSHVFKYLVPPLVFAPLIPLASLHLPSKESPISKPTLSRPATPETLLITLSDLHSIQALLPPSPFPNASSVYTRFRLLGPWRLVRGLVVIWITWISLGRLVGYRSLLAFSGSILLLLPSPPLAQLIRLLSKSLAVRRAVALIFLLTFGSPPDQSHRINVSFSPLGWVKSKWAVSRRPSLAFAFRPKMGPAKAAEGSAIEDDDLEDKAGNPIYFKFEVQENQRWWMGLDWTSALLPQERPSWCDSHLLPVSPPPSFSLPAAASIILPAPTKTDPSAKVKRTATWRWLDDDWSILKTTSLSGNSTQVTPIPEVDADTEGYTLGKRPASGSFSFGTSPPSSSHIPIEDTSMGPRAPSIAEQAFTKGLERLKARTTSPAGAVRPAVSSPSKTDVRRARTGSQVSEDISDDLISGLGPVVEHDGVTDQDGWVYGDNKWEGMSPRGGLGKFTRRRRWQRRAVCTEVVYRIPSSPIVSTSDTPKADLPTFSIHNGSDVKARASLEEDRAAASVAMVSSTGPVRDDQLRLRLKKAMGSVGG